MIQRLKERRPGFINALVVHHPPQNGVGFTRHKDVYAEAVSMKSAAFVVVGQQGQLMGRLDLELSFEREWHHGDYDTLSDLVQPQENMAI